MVIFLHREKVFLWHYVWIGHLYQRIGVAANQECKIHFPLTTDTLRALLLLLRDSSMQLCSLTNIPLGLDDPDTKGTFSSLIIDLLEGGL